MNRKKKLSLREYQLRRLLARLKENYIMKILKCWKVMVRSRGLEMKHNKGSSAPAPWAPLRCFKNTESASLKTTKVKKPTTNSVKNAKRKRLKIGQKERRLSHKLKKWKKNSSHRGLGSNNTLKNQQVNLGWKISNNLLVIRI